MEIFFTSLTPVPLGIGVVLLLVCLIAGYAYVGHHSAIRVIGRFTPKSWSFGDWISYYIIFLLWPILAMIVFFSEIFPFTK